MLVISDVQLSDTGPYHFHARNFEKEMEYIVNLYVLEWEPEVEFVSADPLFFQKLKFPAMLGFALVPDEEKYLV